MMNNQTFHDMMDTLMGDEERKTLDEVLDEASRYGFGPFRDGELREEISNSTRDENGEGYSIDRFHGHWQVMRTC